MKIKNLYHIALLLLFLIGKNSFACTIPESDAFKSVPLEGGAIIFDWVPIKPEDGGSADKQGIGINANFFDCADGSKKLVSELPFLADTGKVRAAFFSRVGNGDDKELFIIHSVDIKSDTGVRYSGDYYTVLVYKKSGNDFSFDEKLSNYFSSGGDILAENNEDMLYTFPYKTELSILEKLKSGSYKRWILGDTINLVLNKKTFIYSSPVLTDVTRMYLIAGDKVIQEAVEGGWLSVSYKTAKGKNIQGWILCANADGC
ncbi:hypothetical protein ACW9H6_11865 [Pseudomonas sp. SDO528_S397]